MSFEGIRTGSVIRYPYLWAREADRLETERRKPRPTAVGVRMNHAGRDMLLLLAITTRSPPAGRLAVEIPDTEKHRAGLERAMRLWIMLDEYNTDIVGQSFHLEPAPPIGQFSKAFFLPVMRSFVAYRRNAVEVARR